MISDRLRNGLRPILRAARSHPELKRLVHRIGEPLAGAYLRHFPVESCPAWLGRASDIAVPSAARRARAPEPTTSGGANINILLHLLDETRGVSGDIAECGVYRGRTLIPIGLYARRRAPEKRVIGFDSFAGFDDRAIEQEIDLGGAPDVEKRAGGFSGTRLSSVRRRLRAAGLESRVRLAPGYFEQTLPAFSRRRFSFVHLDCDIYESYRTCLEFFYPRLSPGAVVLLDEYNDPPWPGCNRAVDEFLRDKPERLREIQRDNYRKWYFQKSEGALS